MADRGRDCWGLVICPIPGQGKYWRVGVFISRAEMGGLNLFAGTEKEAIELL
jgi:hypothetical protein